MIQELNPETLQHQIPLITASGLLLTLPPGTNGKLFLPARLKDSIRTIQTVAVEDAGALESYLTHQATDPSTLALYLDTRQRSVLAVLDHATRHTIPCTNEHRVSLKLEFSAEFRPLHETLNKELSQDAFLDFIDRNAHLFVEAAQLREVCANFHAVTITRVKSVKNLRNGTGRFVYDSEEQQDAEMQTPPPTITTKVALFPDQQAIDLEVMCRYRTLGGKLVFTLLVPGLDALVRKEVAKIELRLVAWLVKQSETTKDSTWLRVPIIRGVPTLTTPLPAEEHLVSGASLPETLKLAEK